jgi:hypothetical protein
MMVSNRLRGYVRGQVARFLTETCTIEREAVVTGVFGEPVHAWEVVGTNVACRLIRAGQFYTSASAVSGTQETLPAAYKLIVANTIALDVDYRVTISGLVYAVLRLETELTDEGFHTALVGRR